MTYNLFLDDERQPRDVSWISGPNYQTGIWHTVANYDQFVYSIENYGTPNFVSFDHDLADEHYQAMLKELEQPSYTYDDGDMVKTISYGPEKTGFDCAKWLVDYCHDNDVPFPKYVVHSMNPVGKERIENYIKQALDKGFVKLKE